MNKKVLGLLGAGHAVTDINQGALPIILTFLQPVLMLSQLQVGLVMLASNLSSSVIQPAFGILSDRFRAVWLIPVGCCLAGLGMAFTGYSTSYHFLMIAALLSGIGVAAYHPEASKYARAASGAQKATGMSMFSVGGNFGFAAGPVLAVLFIQLAGLKGTSGFFILNGMMALLLLFYLSRIESTHGRQEYSPTNSRGQSFDHSRRPGSSKTARAVFILVSFVIMRSWTHAGLLTFLPQYYVHYLHHSSAYAASLVTLFLLSGAVGTLIGGPAADRWGLKNILITSIALMVPLLYFLPRSKGILTLVVVALAGFVLISTSAVTVVFGQELLPNNVGLASGLTLGFGIGMGGVGATFLGWVADTWGLPSIFGVMMLFPLIGLLLALLLPGRKRLAAAGN